MTSSANDTVNPGTLKFGRYIVYRLIGEGGMGKVYLAKDPVLERDVAVKVIVLDINLDEKTRQGYLGRFTLEAKASAKLKHQSIVSVHDAGEEKGVPWIAFEYVDGERLDSLLNHQSKLPVNEAVSIALDIAGALYHAHNNDIVHRDIKPSNILIERSTGIAKIADFGIVKAPWVVLTKQGNVVGSPGYMSPEQINGFEPDPRTDIFSLGVVLYEMLVGKHPFLRDDVQSTLLATLSGKYTPLNKMNPGIPLALESVIDKCLKFDRKKRIQSAEEITKLLISDASLSTYQSYSRQTLGGMAQNITTVLKNGSITGHTKNFLNTRLFGVVKIYESFIKTTKGYLRKIPFLSKRKETRIDFSSVDQTQVFNGRQKEKGTPLTRQVLALSGWYKAFQNVSLKTRIALVIMVIAIFGVLIPSFLYIRSNSEVASLKKEVREGALEQSLIAAKELRTRGSTWPGNELLRRGHTHLNENNIELAAMFADEIIAFDPNLTQAYILAGRTAIKSGDFDKARKAFVMAKKQEDGKALLKKVHVQILADISQELMQEDAQQSLIAMTTAVLTPDDEPLIRSWLESENYWLRWNSVRIMQAGSRSVDMVDVYLLDLQHGPDVDIRVVAAYRLGELGDIRAVSVLKETASKKRRSDPAVAKAAKSVLRKYFK